MAKGNKIGPQKPTLLGNPEARRDKKNKIARETREFIKAKREKDDAQPMGIRLAKRPTPKNK